MSALVHPRRNTKTANKYPQRVTVQVQGGGTANSRGVKNPNGTWTDAAGLSGLYAQIVAHNSGDEKQGTGEGATAVWEWDIFLNDHYAAITERHRVADDGTGEVFNILRVDHDPTGHATVLRCRKTN